MIAISLLLAACAVIGLGFYLYNFFEGENLPGDWLRDYRLGRTPLRALDARCASSATTSTVTVSLTTIPSRLPWIETTIKSLLDQTRPPARIVLNLPRFCAREQRAYDVPPWLHEIATVTINRCDDVGPATKLIPTLALCEPDELIVVVDDDRIYPRRFLAELADAALRMPDAALCCSGWRVPADLTDRPTTVMTNLMMRAPAPVRGTRLSSPYRVDIFQGLSGYAVRPRFFPAPVVLADFSAAPPEVRTVDDVWLSAQCSAPIHVIPVRGVSHAPWRRRRFYAATSLGLRNRGDGSPERRPNTIAIRHFRDRWLISHAP